MSFISFPPSGAIPEYSSFSAFPASQSNGAFAFALDTLILYVYSTVNTAWLPISSPGSVLSIGTIDSISPVANGAVITLNSLIMQSASATVPGLVNITAQAFAGKKTFNAGLDANSNKITSVTDPASAQDAATKNYVDMVASGLNPLQAVYAASTTTIVGTYNNGTAGVGATFTITATGALSLDGTSPALNSRVLLKDQTSGFQNGTYTVTVVGTTGVSPVLTRSLDYNTPTSINAGSLIPVINGTINTTTSWLQTATITTVGTDSLVFVEWSYNPTNFLLKSNNLSDVASSSTSFNNISGMTSLGDTIYGGASGTRSILAGNTTSAKQYLSQTGTGTVSAAPAWATIAFADISGILSTSSGGTGTNTSFTTGAIPFIDGSGNFTQDKTNFNWDDANSRLNLGGHLSTAALGISVTGTEVGLDLTSSASNTALQVSNQGAQICAQFINATNSATQGAAFGGAFSRGTTTARLAVQAGDQIATFSGQAYNGAAFGPGFSGAMAIIATENTTATHNGGEIVLASTPNGTLAPVAGLILGQNQLLQLPAYTTAGFLHNDTSGNITTFTAAQTNAVLPVFTSTLNGLAPLSGGGTTNFLRADGTWTAPAGSGSVTSVALSDGSSSPIFSISGSPITTSGTLTFTLGTQSANTIFAGPSSGAAAQPSFRSMVTADIPSNIVTNAKLAQMSAHTFKGNNTGSTANASDLTATQLTAELNTVTQSLQGLVASAGQLLGTNTNDTASAGNVGEIITATLAGISQSSPVMSTYYDDSGTLSLTAGQWTIYCGSSIEADTPIIGVNAQVPIVKTALRSGVSTIVKEMYSLSAQAAVSVFGGSTIISTVQISSTTVYKMSLTWVAGSGSPTLGAFSTDNTRSFLYAVRTR